MKEEQHVFFSFSKKRMTSCLRLSHFKKISACEAMNTWAALVIMMLDMPKHIDKDEKKGIDEHVRVNYDFACGSRELEINGKDLIIRYYYDSEDERGKNETRRKEEVFEYLDEKIGYIDLSSWGVAVKPCEVEVKKK